MELLIVIAMIAILIGIGYPTFISILEKARKTQAANEEQQIVTAVNGYYTDYGNYPVDVPGGNTTDAYFGSGTAPAGSTSYGTNDRLFDVLRDNTLSANTSANACPGTNLVTCLNPRATVYIQPPISKTGTKAGIDSRTGSPTVGIWFDPFGSPYNVMIDETYNNQLTNPYTDVPGGTTLYLGVVVWSFGKNGRLGGGAPAAGFTSENGTANNFTNSSDVISWQ